MSARSIGGIYESLKGLKNRYLELDVVRCQACMRPKRQTATAAAPLG